MVTLRHQSYYDRSKASFSISMAPDDGEFWERTNISLGICLLTYTPANAGLSGKCACAVHPRVWT